MFERPRNDCVADPLPEVHAEGLKVRRRLGLVCQESTGPLQFIACDEPADHRPPSQPLYCGIPQNSPGRKWKKSYLRPMKKSRFSEAKIIPVLGRGERGEKVRDLCCKLGISDTRRRYSSFSPVSKAIATAPTAGGGELPLPEKHCREEHSKVWNGQKRGYRMRVGRRPSAATVGLCR